MPWSARKNSWGWEGEQASTLPLAMPENAKLLFEALNNLQAHVLQVFPYFWNSSWCPVFFPDCAGWWWTQVSWRQPGCVREVIINKRKESRRLLHTFSDHSLHFFFLSGTSSTEQSQRHGAMSGILALWNMVQVLPCWAGLPPGSTHTCSHLRTKISVFSNMDGMEGEAGEGMRREACFQMTGVCTGTSYKHQ